MSKKRVYQIILASIVSGMVGTASSMERKGGWTEVQIRHDDPLEVKAQYGSKAVHCSVCRNCHVTMLAKGDGLFDVRSFEDACPYGGSLQRKEEEERKKEEKYLRKLQEPFTYPTLGVKLAPAKLLQIDPKFLEIQSLMRSMEDPPMFAPGSLELRRLLDEAIVYKTDSAEGTSGASSSQQGNQS